MYMMAKIVPPLFGALLAQINLLLTCQYRHSAYICWALLAQLTADDPMETCDIYLVGVVGTN
jgi:hypothetical protein